MATVIFFGIPAYGHINPTLPLVRGLVQQGDRVVYYSVSRFRTIIEETGAVFAEYGHLDNTTLANSGRNLGYLYYVLSRLALRSLPDLIRDIKRIKPDYIIHDSLALHGKLVSGICGIPAVNSVTTLVFPPGPVALRRKISFLKSIGPAGISFLFRGGRIQKRIACIYRVPPSGFLGTMLNEEKLNIVYTSRLFQPASGTLNERRFRFIGPSLPLKTGKTPEKKARPLVYISLGTIWKNSRELNRIIRSIGGLDCDFIVSGVKDTGPDLPAHVSAHEHVDQIAVLQRCDLFITHGGMNSASEALFYEVPMLIHPFQAEQRDVAARLEELGCGILIRNFSPGILDLAITRVLGDPAFRNNCRRLSESFSEAGGYQKGIEYIREYLRDCSKCSREGL
ncbi:MAG: hypothetical protein JW874_08930 [Spirochaetales bacterium]|nr:hypothetical protein [Spirochaetales bacterium]